MKRKLIGLLLGAAVLFPAAVVNAQTPASTTSAPTSGNRVLAPFDLVTMAYQGFFEGEGIPPANRFTNRYENGQLSAQDLVQAAIQSNRLPATTLTDSGYIHRVNTQLVAFIKLDR
jgi:hypothetical protein